MQSMSYYMVDESGAGAERPKVIGQNNGGTRASIVVLLGRGNRANVTDYLFVDTGDALPTLTLPSPIWRWKKFSISV